MGFFDDIGNGIGFISGGLGSIVGGVGGSAIEGLTPGVEKFGGPGRLDSPEAQRFLDVNGLDKQFNQFGNVQGGFRDTQRGLAHRLQAQANGTAPSLADRQLALAQQRGLAQQQALAAGARGPNRALAQRQAAINSGNLNSQLAAQGVGARLQEQRQAQGLLANVATQARQQDLGTDQLTTQQAIERERIRQQKLQAILGQPTAFERGSALISTIGSTAATGQGGA